MAVWQDWSDAGIWYWVLTAVQLSTSSTATVYPFSSTYAIQSPQQPQVGARKTVMSASADTAGSWADVQATSSKAMIKETNDIFLTIQLSPCLVSAYGR